MKRLYLTLLSFILWTLCCAQNLVPNPSFEEYNSCPSWPTQIAYSPDYDSFPTVNNWITPVYEGTPNYFNICAQAPQSSVPCNFISCRVPRTGNAYTGCYTYLKDSIQGLYIKENLEAKLNQPLIAGHNYHVSFYISYVLIKPTFSLNSVSVDRIGAYFSTLPISDSGGNVYVTAIPQIASLPGVFITDTTNWVKIEGTFVASGGEQWITLGKFKEPSPEAISVIADYHYARSGSYIYIDDVCVRDIVENSGDTSVCATSFPMSIKGREGLDGTFEWNTGETTERIDINTAGVYWRIADGECLHFTDTIRVVGLPEIELGNDTTICKGVPMQIGDLQSGVSYLWNSGENICCIIPRTTDVYIVQATNSCGTITDSISVEILNECSDCISIPTAFTPNADNKNDRFNVLARCPIKNYRIRIYDRFGKLVFTTNNIKEGWDGRYRGVPQDANIFYYYLEYIADVPGSSKKMLKGDVMLVR